MSCVPITTWGPHVKLTNISPSASRLCSAPAYATSSLATYPKLKSKVSSYKICNPTCLFGDKAEPKDDNESSPWKALEKAMGGLRKEPSMQDVLREKMRREEQGDYGGGPGSPPGGSGDGSGGSEDEGVGGVWDEVLQVLLATIGLVSVYIYILHGAELSRLAKDYIRYLYNKQKSVRLRRAMYELKRWYKIVTWKRPALRSNWLERRIRRTQTWWYNPRKMKRRIVLHEYDY